MKTFQTEKTAAKSGFAAANLAFLLALVSCIAAGYLYYEWNSLKQEKEGYEASRIQLQDQISTLETDLEILQKTEEDYKSQLDQAAAAKEEQAEALKEAQSELQSLQKEVSELKQKALDLQSLVDKLKSAAEAPVQAAAGVVSAAGDSMEMGGAAGVVRSAAIAFENPANPMQVKTINRKFNFVVFDRSGNAIQAGEDYRVTRNGAWIADIKIQKVYDKFASAEIRKESDDNLLQIGDEVRSA